MSEKLAVWCLQVRYFDVKYNWIKLIEAENGNKV